MAATHNQIATFQNILDTLNRRSRLNATIRLLAREVERLDEDNAQMRAAVSVYRQVIQQLKCEATGVHPQSREAAR